MINCAQYSRRAKLNFVTTALFPLRIKISTGLPISHQRPAIQCHQAPGWALRDFPRRVLHACRLLRTEIHLPLLLQRECNDSNRIIGTNSRHFDRIPCVLKRAFCYTSNCCTIVSENEHPFCSQVQTQGSADRRLVPIIWKTKQRISPSNAKTPQFNNDDQKIPAGSLTQ